MNEPTIEELEVAKNAAFEAYGAAKNYHDRNAARVVWIDARIAWNLAMTKFGKAYAVLALENGRYIAWYFQLDPVQKDREIERCNEQGIETKTVRCDHTMEALKKAVDDANEGLRT